MDNQTLIRSIIISPQCAPHTLRYMANNYEQTQALVGGVFNTSHLEGGLYVTYHDEGLLIGLPPNVRNERALLVGTLVVNRMNDEGDNIDTTIEDFVTVKKWLAQCERPGHFEYDIPGPVITSFKSVDEMLAAERKALDAPRIVGMDGAYFG
jgi:hypothetical protein